MKFRTIALTVAAVAALAPAISMASPEKAFAKACADAFATSMATPGTATPAYKLAFRGSFGGVLADFYPRDYTFTMVANDAKTRLPIARARCSTNSHGAVIAMDTIPLNDKPAALASSF